MAEHPKVNKGQADPLVNDWPITQLGLGEQELEAGQEQQKHSH